jgi:hypothetical protein
MVAGSTVEAALRLEMALMGDMDNCDSKSSGRAGIIRGWDGSTSRREARARHRSQWQPKPQLAARLLVPEESSLAMCRAGSDHQCNKTRMQVTA